MPAMSEQEYWGHRYNFALDNNMPAMVLMPRLSIDGNQWCALYGDNLQDGVAGFGGSPYEAYQDFNKSWFKELAINDH